MSRSDADCSTPPRLADARHAKAQHSQGVHDPAREKSLLEARQQWGREKNLSEPSITDVFEAILRFSRAEQRRGW